MAYLVDYHGAGAYALGLLATLVLAAYLTPRRWWRRPNARALAVLVAGSWALGSLLLSQLPATAAAAAGAFPATATVTATASTAVDTAPVPAPPAAGPAPEAGTLFRTHHDLNLRSGASVASSRLLLVPAGATVTATGVRRGDWWQVSATVAGQRATGWASSLWLRRRDEAPRAAVPHA
jgi:Flp pilus assembly protein TadB